MSTALIDTQALIWLLEDSPKLSPRAIAVFDDPSTPLVCSVASVWEMAIKIANGKLRLRHGSLDVFIQLLHDHGIGLLPILAAEAADVARSPEPSIRTLSTA